MLHSQYPTNARNRRERIEQPAGQQAALESEPTNDVRTCRLGLPAAAQGAIQLHDSERLTLLRSYEVQLG
jgi:hypothetical protein